jgi:hypothetical protein
MGPLLRSRRLRLLLASVTVPLALLAGGTPAAALSNQGAFTYQGALTFTPGSGPPISLAACQPTSFTISASGLAADIQIASAEYVGPVTLSGSGSDPCGEFDFGSGPLTAALTGTGLLGEFACSVSGTFQIDLESYDSFSFTGTGSCTVADGLVGSITVRSLQGTAVPTSIELDPLGPALHSYAIAGIGEVCAAWCVI